MNGASARCRSALILYLTLAFTSRLTNTSVLHACFVYRRPCTRSTRIHINTGVHSKPKYLFVNSPLALGLLLHSGLLDTRFKNISEVRLLFCLGTTEPPWLTVAVASFCSGWNHELPLDSRLVFISNVAFKWFPCMPVIYKYIYRPRHGFLLAMQFAFFIVLLTVQYFSMSEQRS